MHSPFITEAQHVAARRVVTDLYEARDYDLIRAYCAAELRHLLVEHTAAPAADFREALALHGYALLEIETATARMDAFDEIRFATVDGVEYWFSNVTL